MQIRLVLTFLVVACALALQPGEVFAAKVFKCVVNGKTVYQDGPCSGTGSSMDIKAGVSHEQHQDAIRRANKDRQQSASSSPSRVKPDHNPQHGKTAENTADPEAAARQKAISDCESQRGVDCSDPATIAEYQWKNTPLTPEQKLQRDARIREERQREPWRW